MFNNTCNCLGYKIFADTLDELPKNRKTVISTINQYSYCLAKQDPDFEKALHKSDILLPDGVGIVAAARFLTNASIKKMVTIYLLTLSGSKISNFLRLLNG